MERQGCTFLASSLVPRLCDLVLQKVLPYKRMFSA